MATASVIYNPPRDSLGWTEVPTTYAASMVLNLSMATRPMFTITVTGNVTFLAPIGGYPGQVFGVRIKQSNGGGYTVSWDSGSHWRGSDTSALPTLTGSTTKPDEFGFIVNGDDSTFDYVAGIKGLS